MKNSDTVIQGLWIGTALSKMEQLCIASYLQNGHDFHLYAYGRVDNTPSGARIMDANEIIPAGDLVKDEFGGYVNFSNKFRYMLLYKKGGWWVDMDTVCLKPFDFKESYVFSSEASVPYKRLLVNTTFIKSQPGAPFLKDCIDFINSRGFENIHWGELGVNLISRMIFTNQLSEHIKSPEYFCPYSGHELNGLIQNAATTDISGSYAIHWWNELWKRKGFSKDADFPGDCLYEVLKKKYSVI